MVADLKLPAIRTKWLLGAAKCMQRLLSGLINDNNRLFGQTSIFTIILEIVEIILPLFPLLNIAIRVFLNLLIPEPLFLRLHLTTYEYFNFLND